MYSLIILNNMLPAGHSQELSQFISCCGIFVKIYCCDWGNKKQNGQQLGRRHRQDSREREEEEKPGDTERKPEVQERECHRTEHKLV